MKFFLASLFTILSLSAHAQYSLRKDMSGGIDLGMAFKKNYINPSITYYEMLNVDRSRLLFIGWTARLGAFYGNNTDYYTAPALLTRGEKGFGSLSKPLITQNIDTLNFGYTSQTSLNVGIRAEIHLGPVEIGASADLLGFTFWGRSRIGGVRSSTGLFVVQDVAGNDVQKRFQGADVYQKAHPQRLNLLLLGDNDRGMLATEIYARLVIKQVVGLKVGYQWLSTEMVLNNIDRVANNDRFRNRTGLTSIALTMPITPW